MFIARNKKHQRSIKDFKFREVLYKTASSLIILFKLKLVFRSKSVINRFYKHVERWKLHQKDAMKEGILTRIRDYK